MAFFKSKKENMEQFLFDDFSRKMRNLAIRMMKLFQCLYLIGSIILAIVLFFISFDEGWIGLVLLCPIIGLLTYLIGFGLTYLSVIPLIFISDLLDKVEVIKKNVCNNIQSVDNSNTSVTPKDDFSFKALVTDIADKAKESTNKDKANYDKWLEDGIITQKEYNNLINGR